MMARFSGLHLVQKSAISIGKVEDEYVLDIAAQSGEGKYLAATSSKHTIRLFSSSNLASVGFNKGHTDVISGICWGKQEPSLLYSTSKDKTVRCWDIRTKPLKEVQQFKGSPETDNLFTCVDINSEDTVLCAGQEMDKDDNAFILFWDRRGNGLLGAYSESHQDDITQVCFHPTNPDSLVSGSTDGLTCIFDILETSEEDALLYTWNTCSTVARLGWCGKNWTNVYSTTHMDTFHVWDSVEGDPIVELTDLKEKLKNSDSIEYIVDCLPNEDSDLHLLAGRHSGELKIVDVSEKDKSKVTCTMKGGHSATVRCAHWNAKDNVLVTGAEDSMLCRWSSDGELLDTNIPNKAKFKSKKAFGRRSNPY